MDANSSKTWKIFDVDIDYYSFRDSMRWERTERPMWTKQTITFNNDQTIRLSDSLAEVLKLPSNVNYLVEEADFKQIFINEDLDMPWTIDGHWPPSDQYQEVLTLYTHYAIYDRQYDQMYGWVRKFRRCWLSLTPL